MRMFISSVVHHGPDSENNRGAVPPVNGETVEQSHNMLLLSNKKKYGCQATKRLGGAINV